MSKAFLNSLKYWASQVKTRLRDQMHKLSEGTKANIRESANPLYQNFTEAGIKHRDVKQISREEIMKIGELLRSRIATGGMEAGYAQNLMYSLRVILEEAKNPVALSGNIPSNGELGISVRNVLKSDVQAARITEENLKKLEAGKHLLSAQALRLEMAYGLRREESAYVIHALSLGHSVTKNGDNTVLMMAPSWTKGKRGRGEIAAKSEKPNGEFKMPDGGKTLKEVAGKVKGVKIPYGVEGFERRINYAAEKCGKWQGEKIHPHALRHRYAQERYYELTGMIAPKAGGPSYSEMTDDQKEKYDNAAEIISKELGHSREEICQTYIGK